MTNLSDPGSDTPPTEPCEPAAMALDSLTRTMPILNKRGLHARASAKLVKLVESFDAQVWVEREGMRVPGHSIMGLMMLAAAPGTEIVVIASGPDAARALDAITSLVGNRFDEEE